jgi:sulfite dehydrogenase (quinone) subunit SoeC
VHPAPSLIVFTTLSGAGFGLMAVLSLGLAQLESGGFFLAAALAFGLSAAGLVLSLFHLGHPERAWRALSQWRSSWLSREGVLALATLAAFAAYAGARLRFGVEPVVLGGVAALLCTATVFATAMIYAQLRTVPRWHTPLTPAIFVAASLAGGALLAGAIGPASWGLAALAVLQLADWVLGDRRFAAAGSTRESATALGPLGRVRQLEAPHSGGNYLLSEMVFVVARRHARPLRAAGIVLAALLPLALVLLFEVKHTLGGIVVLSHVAGMLALRWLFYAEAEHVVGLYYGKR